VKLKRLVILIGRADSFSDFGLDGYRCHAGRAGKLDLALSFDFANPDNVRGSA
jgi:hypothetical protein